MVDMSIFMLASYGADDAEQDLVLEEGFRGTRLQNVSVVARDRSHIIHWYEAEVPSLDMTVFAVRGTSTAKEAFVDCWMYNGIVILEFFSNFSPILEILPEELQKSIGKHMSIPMIQDKEPWYWAQQRLSKIVNEGKKVIVTGHSLGGSISTIIASRARVPAVAFSPAGAELSSLRFGIDLPLIRRSLTAIVPHNDPVTKIDRVYGSLQYIDCDETDSSRCHSTTLTMCALHESCGDDRGRNWSSFCSEQAQQAQTKSEEDEMSSILSWMSLVLFEITTLAAYLLLSVILYRTLHTELGMSLARWQFAFEKRLHDMLLSQKKKN